MRKLYTILLILITVALPALGEEANMIYNPGCEELDGISHAGWYADMWDRSGGISVLDADADGYDGACLKITNELENDARFCQDIIVEPDTIYYISCMAKTDNVGSGARGANISILDTYSYSNELFGTVGEWTKLEIYGKTGEDQTLMTLCARLGGYSGVNTGAAWFDSFEMYKVETVPAGHAVQDFEPMTSSSADISGDENAEPQRYTETWVLAAFGMALAMLAVYRRRDRFPSDNQKCRCMLVIVLAAALAVRLVVAYMVRGYNTDINCFSSWAERMYRVGIFNFYSPDYWCDYPPLYMCMLAVSEMFRNLFGLSFQSAAHIVLLKLIPILFDLGLAALLYAAVRRYAGSAIALLAAVICALNPAAIVDSAAWGQIDSVFTFFTVLGAVYLAYGRYVAALPVIVIAILIKPQALLFAPLGLVALIADIARSDNKKKALTGALVGLGAGLGVILLCAAVFHEDGTNPVGWIITLYKGTMEGYPRFTVNACSLYYLLDLNWVELPEHSSLALVSWILFAFSYAYTALACVWSRRRSSLFLCAGALIILICAFGPMIHERYVYPALVLLLLAYGVEKDWRIMLSLGVVSVTLFLNQLLVLQGGMTAANYGHLQSSEDWLNDLISFANVLNAGFIAYVTFDICFLGRRFGADARPEAGSLPRTPVRRDWRLRLKAADYIIMAVVTAAYAVVAFTGLGSTSAPQTAFRFTQAGESVTFDLSKVRTWRMEYYGGICNTNFTVEISSDGISWTEPVDAVYDQGEIFRWIYFVPSDSSMETIYNGENTALDGTSLTYASALEKFPCQTARYVRITARRAGLDLMEIGFIDAEGAPYPVEISAHAGYSEGAQGDPGMLIDEQDTVPDAPSYYNSTYFDEIYHARTAYEHLNGLQTYEWTHPPLGKVLMMIGIKLFGMTPFGWRFMGALAGVAMLPVMYLMAKQLGVSTLVSALAMLLMAFDSMHFTQTRIATIDSYAVFWIMLMYLFMFRYIRMNFHLQPLKKTLVPLALCGVTMGVAWATKWIGIYASAGLAILFFWSFIKRYTEHRAMLAGADEAARGGMVRAYWTKALITTGVCIICFIVIPALIYYFSYYWHMQAEGGLSVDRVIKLQEQIFNYHAGLGGDTHYFRSPWYQWPVIWKPMWYYSGSAYLPEGMVSSISCMGNPAVWWTGLVAMISLMVYAAWKKRADMPGLVIIIGFLSQYLPWVIVPRSTFIYHYFASVPFIILATGYLLGKIEKKDRKAFIVAASTLAALALAMFIMFYPLESGVPMTAEYAPRLRWFEWYNYSLN